MRFLATPCPRLIASVDGAIGRLTLANTSRKNAIDRAMWQAIPPAIATLSLDPAVRVVIVSGEGDTFSAGADVAEFDTERSTPEGSRSYEAENIRAFAAIADCPRPTLAAIRGICFGAGAGLALACDLRIATDDALFAIPAARLGVAYPPAAFASIVAAIGAARAKDLFFTGRRIGAQEARDAGLLDRVVDKAEFETELEALTGAIAAGAPMTLTAAKRAIDAAAGLPFARTAGEVQALADACFDSADCAEGIAAFKGKRAPVFSGR